ncbi:Gfo/Idh/MocA family oxidoreductase [Gracilimonas sp.]|uniref:Gfo/Idh/MocA family protein n=1 Tax=Gracilimonas sp. TaxID=1974203 RepID=UPI0028710B26|nr:Gfo/Idh/MocA family oxidoreductase [Gracilimonas sp.]
MSDFTRRKFLKSASVLAAGSLTLPSFVNASSLKTVNDVRIGFIGTGLRGRNHVNNLLSYDGVTCPAICDIDPEAIIKTKEIFKTKEKPEPTVYTGDDYAFMDMLEKEDLDGVIIATNWKWHTPMCLAAMKSGIYTGVEVSGAFSIDECWELVRTHQETGTHLFFLENVNYRRDVMAVLNMVRDNVFGELVHLRGGYQHDLRRVKFNDGDGGLKFGEDSYGEARWRTKHSIRRNGELYPTHGLGPLNNMLDVNRGNRLTSISSFATKSKGLHQFVLDHPEGGENHPYENIDWKLGDIVTSHISTANGETIILTHDTNLPRPYSLGFRVQGVKGLAEFDYHTRRIHSEGASPNHQWDDWEVWFEKYDHELWKKYGEIAVGGGHGGMDYFLDRAFVESVKENAPAVIDVYDAAVMRVITPLSEISIREGGTPQEIPDFTDGNWMHRKPVFGLGDW